MMDPLPYGWILRISSRGGSYQILTSGVRLISKTSSTSFLIFLDKLKISSPEELP